jgi:hypothetical protein
MVHMLLTWISQPAAVHWAGGSGIVNSSLQLKGMLAIKGCKVLLQTTKAGFLMRMVRMVALLGGDVDRDGQGMWTLQ